MHEIGELACLRRQVTHVVELKGLGGVLNQIQHVIHRRDEAMDVFAVQRCYEGAVQK